MNFVSVMWNDIDLYHAVRDFTTDPVTFPGEEVRSFINELVIQFLVLLVLFNIAELTGVLVQTSNHQHYIPIVDAAIAKQGNASDIVCLIST